MAPKDGGQPGTGERMSTGEIAEAYARFRSLLGTEDKEECVRFAQTTLEAGTLGIVPLYEDVLAPAARETFCNLRQRTLCVWEEHVRTSIIRTVLECCYPYLMRERRTQVGNRTRGHGIVVCPIEEYHELGARMAADLFTLCGFEVVFVGANTPQRDILDAVGIVHPVFVGVSVTGPYNLIAARRSIQQLAGLRAGSSTPFQIIVGGRAFDEDKTLANSLGADRLMQTYDDIRRFSEEFPWSSL